MKKEAWERLAQLWARMVRERFAALELRERRQAMLTLVEELTVELQDLDSQIAELESHGHP